MLIDEEWKNKIDFTYIGNPSKDINLLNTRLIEPLSGTQLANEIKKHHIYVTGSINEPSGNHHIEAVQCGLPVLFKKVEEFQNIARALVLNLKRILLRNLMK